MKVLVADKFEKSGLEGLEDAGCDVRYDPDLKDEALADAIRSSGAEVLVVRSTRVTRPMLEAGRLSLVVRAGAGYNTIDVDTASERGIYVANCPGKNSVAVAELAFGLILALDRRIPENAEDLRRGVWNKKEYSKARGLFGRTLGLIGLGGIGCEMCPRARAFGMKVVGWSRRLTPERARDLGIERKDSPTEVAAASDVVSVHVALNPETTKLIGQDFFAAMKPGSFFVNTSRAEVVDQSALERAVREKETGRAPNVVNLAKKSPATHLLVVRHYDRVGVLAEVFDRMKAAGINVQETENVVFDGAKAAVARIHVSQAPSEAVLRDIQSSTADILEVTLLPI
jgi:D-3-phosphoglycerate dehydrogenase